VETVGVVPEETEIDVGKALEYELTGLPGGTDFQNVRVSAVSVAGLRSPASSPIALISTTDMWRTGGGGSG
jgi:hypothetical protein